MVNRLFYTILLLFLIVRWAGAEPLPPAGNSLFATGKWVKIETSSTGIHKLYFSWLKSIGFLHPESVKLFGSRNEAMSRSNNITTDNKPVQIPAMTFREESGNDCLLFFVKGPVTWDYDTGSGNYRPISNQAARGKSWFFLTEDSGSNLPFPVFNQPAGNPDTLVTAYDDFGLWKEENINLLESGTKWFTALFSGGNVLNKSFQFPDRMEKEPVLLNLYAAGRSINATTMDVTVDGNSVGSLHFGPVQAGAETDFATTDSLHLTSILSGPDISISLKYNGTYSDQSWLEYANLQLRRMLQYRGTPLIFRDGRTMGKNRVVAFQISGATSGLQLWDVTNSCQPVQIVYQFVNGMLSFRSQSDSLRSFVLFDPQGQYPGLTKKEDITNADILNTEVPQYLILTPAAFLDQANRLASFHQTTDGMKVAVVTVESVFNDFSGGYPDITALRNFIRYLFRQKSNSGQSELKYLELFGKGTCDPVHEPGENNPNWIPTFQSENSLNAVNSFVSDDFFGLLDSGEGAQNGNMNIGIGRIPAATDAEATIAVDKIIHYHEAQTLGDWRNNITFIADDEDNGIHMNDSEKLASLVNQKNPEYSTSKIYLDAYQQVLTPDERYPDVNEAIRRSVQMGDLIVNYVGHASADGLAQERVLTLSDIDGWTNKDRLPLFVTATCEFSRWDMTVKRSAGEHLCFHSGGGAIALLSATRVVYSSSNFEVNKSFFNHVFDTDNQGARLRLGDLIRLVKNENAGTINTSKFCLLGDPALRLNYPEYLSVNTTINQQSIDQFNGILSPLSLVTITGEIQDRTGKKMELYSGSMTATVFDQSTGQLTLGNGGLPPFSYKVQENILFNGTADIKNGAFSYSFMVPKDVNFNPDAGLIRYYFSNSTTDGNGSFAGIHFNGSETLPLTDTQGPTIHLFLENKSFRDGGTVSENPLLLVSLNDESGINTTGTAIGHDITLELDGISARQIVLNDYYQADPDTWKSGSILYPLSAMTVGPHTLTLKVWDTANNSSTAIVHFNVDTELKFDNVYNYPNPFSDQTRFVISQNRYDELFTVNLEILDLTGRLVYTDSQVLSSVGYSITDLYWNPWLSNPLPAKGLYLYRITLTGQDGRKASHGGRLIWSR